MVENNLPSDNEQIGSGDSDNNEDNAQIEINLVDNTENNTPLESPIVPLKEDLGVIITNEDSPINNGLKSYEEAVIEIKKLKGEGLGNTAIAKELTGKYQTKQGLINWSDTQGAARLR